MPRRRKPRRRNRRRRRARPSNSWISNQPLQSKVYTSHKYVQAVAINPGAAALAKQVFSANGMWDPDKTGGGHQPLGFDQLSLLYDHYTVVGFKIEVQFLNTDGTHRQTCGVSLMDDFTGFTGDFVQYAEQPRTRYKLLPTSGGTNPLTLKGYFSAKKFFGKKNVLDEKDLEGDSSKNPDEGAWFHIWAGDPEGDDTSKVDCLVTITYSAVWTEPKTLAQS